VRGALQDGQRFPLRREQLVDEAKIVLGRLQRGALERERAEPDHLAGQVERFVGQQMRDVGRQRHRERLAHFRREGAPKVGRDDQVERSSGTGGIGWQSDLLEARPKRGHGEWTAGVAPGVHHARDDLGLGGLMVEVLGADLELSGSAALDNGGPGDLEAHLALASGPKDVGEAILLLPRPFGPFFEDLPYLSVGLDDNGRLPVEDALGGEIVPAKVSAAKTCQRKQDGGRHRQAPPYSGGSLRTRPHGDHLRDLVYVGGWGKLKVGKVRARGGGQELLLGLGLDQGGLADGAILQVFLQSLPLGRLKQVVQVFQHLGLTGRTPVHDSLHTVGG
jgi:hypothetical protein